VTESFPDLDDARRARSAASSACTPPVRTSPRLTYFGLFALQHRGQESAGIAVSDGRRIVVHKDMGLVNQVFTDTGLAALQGHLAIGHCRYSTTGSSSWATPSRSTTRLPPAGDRARPQRQPGQHRRPRPPARPARHQRLGADGRAARPRRGRELEEAIAGRADAGRRLLRGGDGRGALHAFRDPHGLRPLQIGRLPAGGWVVASETAAIDIVGAVLVRDVEPGELVTIDEQRLHSRRFADPTPVLPVRVGLPGPPRPPPGRRQRAQRAAPPWVAGSPRGPGRRRRGDPGARGRPRRRRRVRRSESGIAFADGLVKNRYVGRTFIQPTQSLRQMGIRSSSPRCARWSRAAGWSWSTTRSCGATPPGSWSRCCARPVPPRCTCGSPRRRSPTPATTASTWLRGRS
jgi:amidophosphoribosyltransferase